MAGWGPFDRFGELPKPVGPYPKPGDPGTDEIPFRKPKGGEKFVTPKVVRKNRKSVK